MVTPKYNTYLTVSFPPMIMDLIIEHCYLTGVSRQDFVRVAVRNLLTSYCEKDVELEMMDRLRQKKIYEKNNK